MTHSPKILLIDDDVLILNLAKAFLQSLACDQVILAEGGDKALQLFEGHPKAHFDLIILDLHMPGIDGVQFIRKLAEAGFGGALAILSGASQNLLHTVEGLATAHNINILGSIKKPINVDSFSELLDKYHKSLTGVGGKGSTKNSSITSEDIERAIDNEEFFLMFQPKVAAQGQELLGVEALCRWIHQEKGFIPPSDFIPLAESSGLIGRLTKYVIRTAMREIKKMHSLGHNIHISINVSTSDLEELDFPEYVVLSAKNADLQHKYIILEVTESRLAENVVNTLEVFVRLSLQGIKLSIDDFGTGYSSQEKLKTLPFSELKIDQSFSNNVHKDPHLQAIVKSNITLAKSLGLETTVEGIETQEDLEYVTDEGCDVIQGYFIARPMKMNDLISWANNWKVA